MDKINVGYVQGVHGLRGDLKVKNRFDKPEKVFIVNQRIYLNDEEHTITACKYYKGFYLVTIDNLKNINLVEHYKGYDVYINKEDLKLKPGEYILDDLYGMTIISSSKEYGIVKDVLNNGVYYILVVNYEKQYMIPLVDKYVERVDLKNKTITVVDVESLIL